MGKKRPESAAVGASPPTLSEQIDQQEQARLLREVQQRRQSGKPLTPKHKAAVRRHEESTLVRLLGGVGKTLAAWLLDSSSKVINDAMRKRGFPWPEGNRDRVNVVELLRWLWRYYIEHPLPDARAGGLTEEDVLLVGASPDLKDEFLRERIRERRLVNRQKSMELVLLEESHIPTERVAQFAMGLAEVARKRSEDEQRRFESRFGPDAAKMVAQMYEDFADAALKRFENEFGDGDKCDDDATA